MQTLRRRCLPLRKELALSSPGDNPRPVLYADKLGLFAPRPPRIQCSQRTRFFLGLKSTEGLDDGAADCRANEGVLAALWPSIA